MNKKLVLMGISIIGAILTGISQIGLIQVDTENAVNKNLEAKDTTEGAE